MKHHTHQKSTKLHRMARTLLTTTLLSTSPSFALSQGDLETLIPGLGDILNFAKRNEKWLNTMTDITTMQDRFGDQQAWKDAFISQTGAWLAKNANWTTTDAGKFIYNMMGDWENVRRQLDKINAQWIVQQLIPLKMQDQYNLYNPLAFVSSVSKDIEIREGETQKITNLKTDQQTQSILASSIETNNKYNTTIETEVLDPNDGVTSKFGNLIANSTSTREAMQITATAIVEQINQQALSTSAIMSQLSRQIEQQTITNHQLTAMVNQIIDERNEKLRQQKADLENLKNESEELVNTQIKDIQNMGYQIVRTWESPCLEADNVFEGC